MALRRRSAIRTGKDHGEFLAAVAGHQIFRPPHHLLQGLGHPLEGFIPFQVAIAVVVGLEVIHIQQAHGQRLAAPQAAAPLPLEHLIEMAPVGHTREAVAFTQGLEATVGFRQFLGA